MTQALQGNLRCQTLRFLFGNHAIAAKFEQEQLWNSVIRLCLEWNVAPWLRKNIAECGARLTEVSQGDLDRAYFGSGLMTARSIKSGLDAIALLEINSIPCAGFKGIASIAHLYGIESGLRSMHDVDIVIAPGHKQEALDLLLANGYRPDIEIAVHDYTEFVRKSPGSGGNQAIGMTNARGGCIDLHWQLSGIDTEGLLARAVQIKSLGRTTRVVSPIDSMLLSVHHALRNNFAVDRMLHDVIDFEGWRERFREKSETAELLEYAARWKLTAPLLAMEKISSATRGFAADWLIPHATGEELRQAEDMAELFAHQVRSGTLREDLVYLSDPRTLLGIATAATSGWNRFRTTMKRMDEAKGAPETLLTRLGRLLSAIPQVGPGRWGQLRRLARAKRAVLDDR